MWSSGRRFYPRHRRLGEHEIANQHLPPDNCDEPGAWDNLGPLLLFQDLHNLKSTEKPFLIDLIEDALDLAGFIDQFPIH